jgi:hydroxymethylbilane synthase
MMKVVSRKSELAKWQARSLMAVLPQPSTLLVCESALDLKQDQSVRDLIGMGMSFTKEVDHFVISHKADIACHSAKDLGLKLDLALAPLVLLARDIPNDAWLGPRPEELPNGAVVGTDSPRRESLINKYYPHLKVRSIRGNVGTRIERWQSGHYDAIVLAACGIQRLALDVPYTLLPLEQFVPAMNQGIIVGTMRKDHPNFADLYRKTDQSTLRQFEVERAVGQLLSISCHEPIGIHANGQGQVFIYLGKTQQHFVYSPEYGDLEQWIIEILGQ